MRKSTPAFTPGRFQPVVDVAQRDAGYPAPLESDFSGLEEVTATTLEVANASARGSGAVLPSVVPSSSVAKVIGLLLACKNIVEQLSFLSVYTRVSGPLRQSPECLEPIVKAYGYYGHFVLNDKLFVTRGLESSLVFFLFKLRQWANPDICSLTKNVINCADSVFSDIDFSFYNLSPDGNIVFGKRKTLKEYLVDLATALLEHDFSVDAKLPVVRNALDVTTEEALTAFLRNLRLQLSDFTPPSRILDTEPTKEHKAAMKKLFGQEYSSDNEVIPVAKFSEVISLAFSLLRTITQERGYVMKTIPFPKYEGGSATQLAELVDDVLFSEVPIALDDSTLAIALSVSSGCLYRYRSAPNLDRNETRRSLVSQSLIKR